MNAYIYQAALLCEACGDQTRLRLHVTGKAPANTADESTFDSDDYPKGPYPNGGGESDSPQHCDSCGVFLENPLTSDGLDYVREQLTTAPVRPESAVAIWADFYRDALGDPMESLYNDPENPREI